MRTITEVLDRAKRVQKVTSDYKLSLTTGIGESSLFAYRNKGVLPDEINCKKLADAMGEDAALLTVEMQAQRAKSPEAREVWLNIAKRLQMGVSSVLFSLVLAIVAIAANALPVSAATVSASAASPGLYIMLTKALSRFVQTFKIIATFGKELLKSRNWGKFSRFTGLNHVPRHAHAPAFLPA
jgi:hypothetical protein